MCWHVQHLERGLGKLQGLQTSGQSLQGQWSPVESSLSKVGEVKVTAMRGC